MKTLEGKIEAILYDLLAQGGGNGATLTKYARRITLQARRDLLAKPPKKILKPVVKKKVTK